eukprot:5013240-Alexandrium_andersonii.AAC.1
MALGFPAALSVQRPDPARSSLNTFAVCHGCAKQRARTCTRTDMTEVEVRKRTKTEVVAGSWSFCRPDVAVN